MATANGVTREYVRFEVIDMNCKALSKTVPARHRSVPVFMYSGAIAMGANSEVLTFPEEVSSAGCPNCKLLPDWSTDQVLPWACHPGAVTRRVFCEQARPGATGANAAEQKNGAVPRTVCNKLLKELRSFGGHGYELLVGGELEFTVAKPDEKGGWAPYFGGVDIFATLQNAKAMDFCYEVERNMESVGVDILTMNAEYGAGQLEIAFAPKFGIEACDMTATFRTGTKEIAQNKGLRASFISRPWGIEGVGNGGHLNFSLWAPDTSGKHAASSRDDIISRVAKGKTNVFHSPDDSQGLSETAKHFLAGVLEHAPALEAVCAPTPPCYTRHGHWAPVVANWGPEDRMACVRVKADKAGDPASCYMELRMPSASANPYLVVAAIAAAGLDGLERKLELPAARQTKDDGAAAIPKTLGEALAALEADKYMVEKLGSDFVRWYRHVKDGEQDAIEGRLQKGVLSEAKVADPKAAFLNLISIVPWSVLGTRLTCDKKEITKAQKPDLEMAFVDPAGLGYIQEKGPCNAGAASGAIYSFLGIKNNEKFPEEVVKGIPESLYAKLHKYDNAQVIHAVGPDFRTDPYVEGSEQVALSALTTVYFNILSEYAASDLRRLRLLPMSGGVFSGKHAPALPKMTVDALGAAFERLGDEQRQRILASEYVELCIFMEKDFQPYATALRGAEEVSAAWQHMYMEYV